MQSDPSLRAASVRPMIKYLRGLLLTNAQS
jgi:hypothetical protein